MAGSQRTVVTMTSRPLKARVWKSESDSLWYWNIVAGNGEILASSEGHENKGDAVDVAWQVIGSDGDIEYGETGG